MSLAAARLGWPLQDTEIVSLHGRDLHEIIRYLQPGRRVIALAWDRFLTIYPEVHLEVSVDDRIYRTPRGPSGWPEAEWIRDALLRAVAQTTSNGRH